MTILIPKIIASNDIKAAARRGEQVRQVNLMSLLLEERIIFLGDSIFPHNANEIVAALLYLNQQDPERNISMYINSPGGVVYSGLAIYDTMQSISNPISTFAVGVTASMATVLLAAGTPGQRYALPHATAHMHPAGGGAQGYTPDVEIQFKEMKRLQDTMHHIISKHTGQSVQKIADDFERDRWMDALAAKEYGLVDEVMGTPILSEAAEKNKTAEIPAETE